MIADEGEHEESNEQHDQGDKLTVYLSVQCNYDWVYGGNAIYLPQG